MALKLDDDGVPEIFKKVYKYFEDDQRMWDIVNDLVIYQMVDSKYIKIAKMVQKKRNRDEIIGEILDANQIYKDLMLKIYKKDQQKRTANVKAILRKYENGVPKEDKKDEIIKKEKKHESKESINSRQKSFRARRTQNNSKRVSFYVSEENKAKMDALRLEKGITQEKLLNEMIQAYLKSKKHL